MSAVRAFNGILQQLFFLFLFNGLVSHSESISDNEWLNP